MGSFLDGILDWLEPVRGPMEIPFEWLMVAGDFYPAAWWYLVYDLVVVALAITLARLVFVHTLNLFKRDTLADTAEIDAILAKNANIADAILSDKELLASLGPLKRKKDWKNLGEAYSALSRPKDAAKAFKKAGEMTKASNELAKAGQSAKAARWQLKAGNFSQAGDLFMQGEKFAAAAKAYQKQGDMARAAEATGRGGKLGEGMRMYLEYFTTTREGPEARIVAAEKCYALFQDPQNRDKFSDEDRKGLYPKLAEVFEKEEQLDKAAPLYQQAGDHARAGEVYLRAGKLQEASQCMKAAGKPKEAARIGGRYYESIKKWREAGLAYVGAEEYQRAGDCFSRAKDPVRAAECFSKAESWSQAGLAYAHAGRFEDAVKALQRVGEGDKDFSASRALLGRSFYELHDYAHCAATLENHLTGARVDSNNMEYFYMMALAFEQLGKLQESRDILYKIGAVRKEFRDVGQRISSIDSRISMMGSGEQAVAAGSGGSSGGDVMGLVQNTLGDRYTFEKELGRGGMGVVYLAKDKQLDRKVALKFLGSLVDSSDEYRKRFVREAKTAAKISHPNIIAIYDISASEGKAYIAMEYVEGSDLHHYVSDKGKLTPREATNIMIQASSALAAIHEAGIVHRDIKPDNILIAKGGLVKLMDFGLAKAEDNRMTRTGIVMGTPCYMSPEQVMGKDVDGRSDLYAMGLVFYEMLSGELVFGDGDILERQVKEVPPSPGTVVEGLPPEIEKVIMKSIEKKPEDRYQNAEEIVAELRKVQF